MSWGIRPVVANFTPSEGLTGEAGHVQSRGDAVAGQLLEVGDILGVAMAVNEAWNQDAPKAIDNGGNIGWIGADVFAIQNNGGWGHQFGIHRRRGH